MQPAQKRDESRGRVDALVLDGVVGLVVLGPRRGGALCKNPISTALLSPISVSVSKRDRARSRLYRNEILQVNMRLKALAEIYTIHLCVFGRKEPNQK